MILLLLLVPVTGFKTTDLSKTSGITPIKIQDAFIINNTYTYMHNINVRILKRELNNLENIINKISIRSNDNNRISMINLHLKYTKIKLDHLHFNSHRIKRGLVNGIGSAISWLTGNMDADDKAKYDSILQSVQSNEYHLEHNVEKQLSINRKIIDEFNKDMKIMHSNNIKLSNYFNYVSNQTNEIELNQQFSFLFSNLMLIYNKVNDLDTSLEFCKLNIIHSSILSYDELNYIIKKAKVKFISNEPGILWQLGIVYCSIHNDYISYFIKLPLQSLTYETFFLLSYPVYKNNEILTILQHPSFILRYDELLTGNCVLINNAYYCKNTSVVKNSCINELLEDNELNNCRSLTLSSSKPFIKYIPIINQYLMYNISKITIIVNKTNVTIHPKLTQLLTLNNSEQLVNFTKTFTFWESNIMIPSQIPSKKHITNFTFEQIHEANIKIEPLEMFEELPIDKNRLVYSILLAIFIILLVIINYQNRCLIFRKLCFRRCNNKDDNSSSQATIQNEGLRLQVPNNNLVAEDSFQN